MGLKFYSILLYSCVAQLICVDRVVLGFFPTSTSMLSTMDSPPIKKRHRQLSNAFLPDELIAEILSFFEVKTIVQLKCVSKSWNNLISEPTFVEKHHQKSSQNPHLTLCWHEGRKGFNVTPFPVHCLLQNPSITVNNNKFHRFKVQCKVVGSCNGLLCLLFHSIRRTRTVVHWFRFWNPATRKKTKKLGLCYSTPRRIRKDISTPLSLFKFTFCYDASTRTYKVVAFRVKNKQGEVKVFSLGTNYWRNIQSFPVSPLNLLDCHYRRRRCRLNDGVHLSGTVNWLATYKPVIHVIQYEFVIVSLDLSTESYKQLLPPLGFDEVPFFQPVLSVLMDGICFSYDSKRTEFVLWHMKEYGVQNSWTQLFKISYQNLPIRNIDNWFEPMCFYVTGDSVILATNEYGIHTFIYNLKNKSSERIKIRNCILWLEAKEYVESLVSVR